MVILNHNAGNRYVSKYLLLQEVDAEGNVEGTPIVGKYGYFAILLT
jgi:hypothetical protein